jgi:thioredoxin-like negative regulator of GroEL
LSGGVPVLTLLYREDCGLCEEMLSGIEALGRRVPLPALEQVDVDSDPELARRYGLEIPVLLLDGSVVCRTRLDADELMRLLRPRSRP